MHIKYTLFSKLHFNKIPEKIYVTGAISSKWYCASVCDIKI